MYAKVIKPSCFGGVNAPRTARHSQIFWAPSPQLSKQPLCSGEGEETFKEKRHGTGHNRIKAAGEKRE